MSKRGNLQVQFLIHPGRKKTYLIWGFIFILEAYLQNVDRT